MSCSSQEITIEGKWKVNKWIYVSHVGRSLDKEEQSAIDKLIQGLIIDFKSDGTISTNKKSQLKFIENDSYKLDKEMVLFTKNGYRKMFIKNNKCFLRLINNIIFEVEKIENYSNSKQFLTKFIKSEKKLNDYKNKEINDFVLIPNMNDKNICPTFKSVDLSDCGYNCVENSFNETILDFIDFSKVHKDTTYFIEFIVDKTGEICNVQINSNNRNNLETSDIKEDILHSILIFQGNLSPAERNKVKVNSKIKLTLRLISN